MQPEAFREILRQHASHLPQPLALRGDTRRYTYAQLLAEVERRENLLRAEPDGVLALGQDNSPEALIWDLAALFSRRPCLILPPFFSPAQRAHCLEQCQVRLAVLDAGFADEIEALKEELDSISSEEGKDE